MAMVDVTAGSSQELGHQSALSRRVLLCACGLLIFFSSRREFRVQIGDLLVPIVLAPLMLLAARLGLRGLRRLSRQVLQSSVVFWLVFSGAVVAQGGGVGESVKLLAFLVAVVVIAAGVKNRRDFVLGSSALVLGVFLVACGSLLSYEPTISGLDPIATIGNKNAYSVYALPAILLGTHLLTAEALKPMWRLFILAQTMTITLAIFATGNRSGWLGAATVGVLILVSRRRIRDAIVLCCIVGVVFVGMGRFGYLESFEYRIEQTRIGDTADSLRRDLIVESFRLGSTNPALGVGPQHVARELGARFGVVELSPHHVYAYMAAGGGLPLLLSCAWFMSAIFRVKESAVTGSDRRPLLTLAQMCVVLLAIRGWYSEEVLFNMAFAIGLGLSIGREHAENRKQIRGASPVKSLAA